MTVWLRRPGAAIDTVNDAPHVPSATQPSIATSTPAALRAARAATSAGSASVRQSAGPRQ